MKKYSCPQITEYMDQPSDIIAVSIIDGGSADEETPVQGRDNEFMTDWNDMFADKNRFMRS